MSALRRASSSTLARQYHVDEGLTLAAPAQREAKDLAVEGERFLDVADLERDAGGQKYWVLGRECCSVGIQRAARVALERSIDMRYLQ
jgi:hypothetical protein